MGKNKQAYQFLKDARNGKHLDMCQEWKNLLDEKFPELIEKKEEFEEEGFAISVKEGAYYSKNELGRVVENSQSNMVIDFMDGRGIGKTHHPFLRLNKNGFKKATDKQVEEFLKREAERRGFKVGVRYKCVDSGEDEKLEEELNFYNDKEGIMLTDGCGEAVYNNGKWAEIIPEAKKMTKEEIEKELGYKIEVI